MERGCAGRSVRYIAVLGSFMSSQKDADLSVAQCVYHRFLSPHDLALHHFYNRQRISLVREYIPRTGDILCHEQGLQSLPSSRFLAP
jgi:hypothetical protein